MTWEIISFIIGGALDKSVIIGNYYHFMWPSQLQIVFNPERVTPLVKRYITDLKKLLIVKFI